MYELKTGNRTFARTISRGTYVALTALFCMLLAAGCKDSDESNGGPNKNPIEIGTISVVEIGQGSSGSAEASALESNFWRANDELNVRAIPTGTGAEKTGIFYYSIGVYEQRWVRKQNYSLYYEDVAQGYNFKVSFGASTLRVYQDTDQLYHLADYMEGDATLNTTNLKLNSNNIERKNAQMQVTFAEGEGWDVASNEFNTSLEGSTVELYSKDGVVILPLKTQDQFGTLFFTALMPLDKMPSSAGDLVLMLTTPEGNKYPFVLTENVVPEVGKRLSVNITYSKNSHLTTDFEVTIEGWEEIEVDAEEEGIELEPLYKKELVRFMAWVEECRATPSGEDIELDFTLRADINLSAYDFEPIGPEAFAGTFDGDGYTITIPKLTANGEDNIGLFKTIAENGVITNLLVSAKTIGTLDVNDEGLSSNVGAIAGVNNGTIYYCDVIRSNITGKDYVGGIVGANNGTITGAVVRANSHVYATGQLVGGIAGYSSTLIDSCTVKGLQNKDETTPLSIRGGDYTGGIVGSLGDMASLSECAVQITSVEGQEYVGGVTGLNLGAIEKSIYEGIPITSIIGTNFVGGISGYAANEIEESGVDAAIIYGRNNVGGLSGINFSTLINNTVFSSTINGTDNVGGASGYSLTVIEDCVIGAMTIVGTNYVGGLVGLNESPISNTSFVGDVTGSGMYIGGIAGTNSDVDITKCTASGSVTGGSSYVGGIAGYISDCDITESDYLGGVITATGDYAGGLAGYSERVNFLTSAATNTSVRGASNVGGIVGYGEATTIDTPTFSGGVSASVDNVGGLAGSFKDGSITLGRVQAGVQLFVGGTYAGGLVGLLDNSEVIKCYSLISAFSYPEDATPLMGGVIGNSEGSNVVDNCYWFSNATTPSESGFEGATNTEGLPTANDVISAWNASQL